MRTLAFWLTFVPLTALAQEVAPEAELVAGATALAVEQGAHDSAMGTVRVTDLRQGRSATSSVTIPANGCAVIAARADEAVTDVEVVIARGRTEIARDGTTGSSAFVMHCAGERPERLTVRATAFRGAGRVAVGAFPRDRPVAAEQEADPNAALGALDRLAALSARVGEGMAAVTPARRETLEERAVVERRVELATGRCYRVLAAGEATVRNLDVEVASPNGQRIQADGEESRDAVLGAQSPLCPAQGGQHVVRIRMGEGHGALAWQVVGSREGATAANPAGAALFFVGGRDRTFLGRSMRDLHGRVGEERAPVSRALLATLGTSAERSMPLRVAAGKCYVVLGVGVPSVRELDLRIVDEHGNEVARDETRDAMPHVRFCANVAGLHTVYLRVFAGYGRTMLQAFAGDP